MYTATITSKGQITIPVLLIRKLGIKKGDKIIFREKEGIVEMEPEKYAFMKLAGSVKIPKRLRGLDLDEIIEKGKREYFKSKYSGITKK